MGPAGSSAIATLEIVVVQQGVYFISDFKGVAPLLGGSFGIKFLDFRLEYLEVESVQTAIIV